MGLQLSEYEASTENYQAQPYGLHNFINMVRIEDYREGSVHTVQRVAPALRLASHPRPPSTSSSSIMTMKALNTIWISQTMP